jgi:hypothetical protein
LAFEVKKIEKLMKKNSPVKTVRNVSNLTKLLLFVRAGGRCEFDGHKKYLLEHPLTLTEINLAQMAHIVAFKENGPRGDTVPRPEDINNIENLMLLCHDCHKLIDDNPDQYSVATLKAYKNSHEDQMYYVTGLSTRLRTTIVQLKSKINDQIVDIPVSHVLEAVTPRYPTNKQGFVIDLTGIEGHDLAYYQTAMQTIKSRLELLYSPGMEVEQTRHISLFAMANIPLLVYFGSRLSNKVPVDFYQRHRDSKNWVWKASGQPAEYKFELIRAGTDKKNVALIVSLTGKVHIEHLPSEIDEKYYLYEITLQNQVPNPDFLKQRDDLEKFASIYRLTLATLMADHGKLDMLHLFPAVPAPIAVVCGYELLPKIYPTIVVHDYDKSEGGFKFSIRINEP